MKSDRRDDGAAGDAEFFEMSLDHLCVAGFDGYWKRLNPSWSRTLGWTNEELMAVPTIEFVHPDDREATLAARGRLREGLPLLTLANRYRKKDGSYCWFEWRSVSDPRRQLIYAIARDITAERDARELHERLQRQLVIADRMASIGTLAAGVAHEINNPLAFVMANLEVLAEEVRSAGAVPPGVGATWPELIEDARAGARRIQRVVRGLMTFAHTGEERRAVTEVSAVVERAIDLASNELRHRARLVRDYGAAPPVDVDEARLGQVLVNLLVNAAQATPDGSVDDHEIRVVTSTDGEGRAVVEVLDTGVGIPDQLLGRIFDPFFTTKPVGVGIGLGLSLCHTLVTAMGGQITAANRAPRGAMFRVTLPAAARRAAASAEPAAPAPAPPSSASSPRRAAVLVVDDEPSIGAALSRLLRMYAVTAVTSARQALDLLLAGAEFDVILSDLMMPEMSGMDLYDELLRHRPHLAERVVFMTGGAFTASASAFLDRVPNERLTKPFLPTELRALVDRYALADRSTARAGQPATTP